VAVEAGGPMGWHKYTGLKGEVVAMEGFGASAPAKILFREFGFTPERVAQAAEKALGK